jgi:hypothetical protein
MSFGISFFSQSDPELVAICYCEDWFTFTTNQLSVGFPCPASNFIENWELVIHPDGLENTILV